MKKIYFTMKKIDMKPDVLDVLKAVLVATLISLALVLIFAIILKFSSLPSFVIVPVNIAIKLVSIFVGCLIGFKAKQNGILKGAVTGLVYMLLTFFIFAAMNAFKDVKFSWIDLITLPIAGALSGIVAVNIRDKKQRAN